MRTPTYGPPTARWPSSTQPDHQLAVPRPGQLPIPQTQPPSSTLLRWFTSFRYWSPNYKVRDGFNISLPSPVPSGVPTAVVPQARHTVSAGTTAGLAMLRTTALHLVPWKTQPHQIKDGQCGDSNQEPSLLYHRQDHQGTLPRRHWREN